jgi:hypothetical protein
MTILMLTPILGPFGGDQLIVALNAGHPEGGTKIGFYHRWNLNVFDSTSVYGRGNGFMAIDYAGIK